MISHNDLNVNAVKCAPRLSHQITWMEVFVEWMCVCASLCFSVNVSLSCVYFFRSRFLFQMALRHTIVYKHTYIHTDTRPKPISYTHSKWYQWRHNAHCCAANSLLWSPTHKQQGYYYALFLCQFGIFGFRFALDFYIIASLFILACKAFVSIVRVFRFFFFFFYFTRSDHISCFKKRIELSQYNGTQCMSSDIVQSATCCLQLS